MSLSQPGFEALAGVGEPNVPSPSGCPPARRTRELRVDRGGCPGRLARSDRDRGFAPACLLYTLPSASEHPRAALAAPKLAHQNVGAPRHDGGVPATPPLDADVVLWSAPPEERAGSAPARAAARVRRRRERPVRARPVPAAGVRGRRRPGAARSAVARPGLLVVSDRGPRDTRCGARDRVGGAVHRVARRAAPRTARSGSSASRRVRPSRSRPCGSIPDGSRSW